MHISSTLELEHQLCCELRSLSCGLGPLSSCVPAEILNRPHAEIKLATTILCEEYLCKRVPQESKSARNTLTIPFNTAIELNFVKSTLSETY